MARKRLRLLSPYTNNFFVPATSHTAIGSCRARLGAGHNCWGAQRAAEPGGESTEGRVAVRRWVVTGGALPRVDSPVGRREARAVGTQAKYGPVWRYYLGGLRFNWSPMSLKASRPLAQRSWSMGACVALDDYALSMVRLAERARKLP